MIVEIDSYCRDEPTEKVPNSQVQGGVSRKIGDTTLLNCKQGYSSPEQQPFTAICVEDTESDGVWNVNGSCTSIFERFIVL